MRQSIHGYHPLHGGCVKSSCMVFIIFLIWFVSKWFFLISRNKELLQLKENHPQNHINHVRNGIIYMRSKSVTTIHLHVCRMSSQKLNFHFGWDICMQKWSPFSHVPIFINSTEARNHLVSENSSILFWVKLDCVRNTRLYFGCKIYLHKKKVAKLPHVK